MNNSHFQIESNICVHIKMYCASSRLRNLLLCLFFALGCVYFLCFISTCNVEYKAKSNIETKGVYLKRLRHDSSPWINTDFEMLIFNLHVNLRDLFNWNVKQVVVSLAAEYKAKNGLEQVILWDRQILKREKAEFYLRDEVAEYSFQGFESKILRGHKNVTLYVLCNVIPRVGNLRSIIAQDLHSFVFPNIYSHMMYI